VEIKEAGAYGNIGGDAVDFTTYFSPPQITILSPNNASYSGIDHLDLNFTVDMPILWASYRIDDGPITYVPADGIVVDPLQKTSFVHVSCRLSLGAHTMFVSAKSTGLPGKVGNGNVTLTMLKTPPAIEISSPESILYQDVGWMNLKFTVDAPISWAQYRIDNDDWINITSENINFNAAQNKTSVNFIIHNLPEGTHELKVRAQENAPYGNIGYGYVYFEIKNTFWTKVLAVLVTTIIIGVAAALAYFWWRHKHTSPSHS
jgi:hypothetical protein